MCPDPVQELRGGVRFQWAPKGPSYDVDQSRDARANSARFCKEIERAIGILFTREQLEAFADVPLGVPAGGPVPEQALQEALGGLLARTRVDPARIPEVHEALAGRVEGLLPAEASEAQDLEIVFTFAEHPYASQRDPYYVWNPRQGVYECHHGYQLLISGGVPVLHEPKTVADGYSDLFVQVHFAMEP